MGQKVRYRVAYGARALARNWRKETAEGDMVQRGTKSWGGGYGKELVHSLGIGVDKTRGYGYLPRLHSSG